VLLFLRSIKQRLTVISSLGFLSVKHFPSAEFHNFLMGKLFFFFLFGRYLEMGEIKTENLTVQNFH